MTTQSDERPFLARWGKGAVLVDHPDLRVGGAGAGGGAGLAVPHADGAVDNSLLWIIGPAIVGCLFVIPTAAKPDRRP